MGSKEIMESLAEMLGEGYWTEDEAANEGFITDGVGMTWTGTNTPADDYAHVYATHEDGRFIIGCESSSGDYQPEPALITDEDATAALLRAAVDEAIAQALATLV